MSIREQQTVSDNTVSWTVAVSSGTDAAVRTALAERGEPERLSQFVEDAVRWRLFDQSLAEARAGFADLSPDQMDALIDEAVTEVRRARTRPDPQAS